MKNLLSENLLETLLYQPESTFLDFKRQQYPFNGANDEQKSELLKDILAFTNSWRTHDAYIVIGVKTEEGARHTIIGCEEHFDDAQLQQFVNSKTNRKVFFSYEIFLIEGKKVGIIIIPLQERPIYTHKDFGKVKKETVYFRLGSSTAIAKPDEIYKMGKDDTTIKTSQPVLDLQFGDFKNQNKLGTSLKLNSIAFNETQIKLPKAIKKPHSEKIGPFQIQTPSINDINPEFWKELEEYTRVAALLRPVSFLIHNQSSILAKNVHIEIIDESVDLIILKTHENFPEKPDSNRFKNQMHSVRSLSQQMKEPSIKITSNSSAWKLMINVGDIKPKSTVWTDYFFIGAKEAKKLDLTGQIFGDNLSNPLAYSLTIEFEVEKLPSLTIDSLRKRHCVDSEVS